jgi:hypothetical protein
MLDLLCLNKGNSDCFLVDYRTIVARVERRLSIQVPDMEGQTQIHEECFLYPGYFYFICKFWSFSRMIFSLILVFSVSRFDGHNREHIAHYNCHKSEQA